jgi:hypothetical protein
MAMTLHLPSLRRRSRPCANHLGFKGFRRLAGSELAVFDRFSVCIVHHVGIFASVVKVFPDTFNIEKPIAEADYVAGILLGRVNLEANSCGVPSKIYDPVTLKNTIFLLDEKEFDNKHNIKNVAKKILAVKRPTKTKAKAVKTISLDETVEATIEVLAGVIVKPAETATTFPAASNSVTLIAFVLAVIVAASAAAVPIPITGLIAVATIFAAAPERMTE